MIKHLSQNNLREKSFDKKTIERKEVLDTWNQIQEYADSVKNIHPRPPVKLGTTEVWVSLDKDESLVWYKGEEVNDAAEKYKLATSTLENQSVYGDYGDPMHVQRLGNSLSSLNKNRTDSVSLENINKLSPIEFTKDNLIKFLQFFDTPIATFLQHYCRINLRLTSLETQISAFSFLSEAQYLDEETFSDLLVFLKEFQMDGFKTLLSLTHGGNEMAEKILTLSQKLPREAATRIFETYEKIINATADVTELLSKDKELHETIPEKARESLYRKGVHLLDEYSDQARECKDRVCEDIGQELIQKLSLAKQSTFALAATTKTLVNENQFSFEEFSDIDLVYEKTPLNKEIAKEIQKMHTVNTNQYPDKLKTYWRSTLESALQNTNPNETFIYVKHQGNPISVMRIIDKGDSWYGASFNVNPTIQGSRIGSELLKEVIGELASSKPFIADCYAENPMLDTYISKFNFKITDTVENYHNTDAKVHQITWNPDQ